MPVFVLPCTAKRVGPSMQTAKGYRFRELLVSDNDPKFPQVLPIVFSRSRTALLDTIRDGDELMVDIEIKGREYAGRHYVTIDGWRIRRKAADGTMLEVAAPPPPGSPAQQDLFADTPLATPTPAPASAPPPPPAPTPAPAAPPAPPQPSPAPATPPEPYDRTRTYEAGDLCTANGKVFRAVVEDGRFGWDEVSSPAGGVEELPPF